MNNFTSPLYTWYSQNKRELPWRETRDPYKIWLSEIILQQTRVSQGLEYYVRFTEAFPKVQNLAESNEDFVLKLWQGLGYYSRARNLHHTAKTIFNNYGGNFPNTYKEILSLKGIGPYTAAAIASIAFGLPHATVDGNVYRVLSRYFGISTPIDSTKGKKEMEELAAELLNHHDPGMHNQALMEFGALQCVPKSPNCSACPLNESCYAIKNKTVDLLPVKEKKTKQRHRYFYYFLIQENKHLYLEKRTANDIWQNLYQLPLVETEKELSDVSALALTIPQLNNATYTINNITTQKKHILSHQIIHARMISIEIDAPLTNSKDLIRINRKDISNFAVPRLLEHFFNEIK